MADNKKKLVQIWLDPMVKLHLSFLSAYWDLNLSQTVAKLTEERYQIEGDEPVTKEIKRRIKRVVKRWKG